MYGVLCFGMGVTLREGNREYFYQHFPGMKGRYIQKYGNQYIVESPNHRILIQLFHQTCEKYGLVQHKEEIFSYLNTFERKHGMEQWSLF